MKHQGWRWALACGFCGVACHAGCSGEDGNEQTPPSGPSQVKLETFNIALAGAFVPNESERRQPLADAIAADESDIICLQEVWRQSDKDLIANAAKGRFPHVVQFKTDLATAVDDPTGEDGQVPPTDSNAPCADPALQTHLNAALDCLRDKCSTIPGSDEGQTTSAECAEEQCVIPAAPLLFGDATQKRCYACVATSLPVSTFAQLRTECVNNPNAGLAFDGQNGVMILSRYPISNPAQRVMPGTWNRRNIITGTVALGAAQVDVYCTHLTPVFNSVAYPYTGPYGGGKMDKDGWAAEQLLQARKLQAWVQQRSGSRRIVIMGDLNSSHAYEAQGIHAEAEATLTLLESVFRPALVPGYVPQCTHCATNPLTGKADAADSTWIDHIFLQNFAPDAVLTTQRVHDEPVVSVNDSSGGTKLVPISDHYGLRSEVRL